MVDLCDLQEVKLVGGKRVKCQLDLGVKGEQHHKGEHHHGLGDHEHVERHDEVARRRPSAMTAVVVEVVPRQSAAKRRQYNHTHRRGRVGDGGMFTGRTGVKAAWFHEIQGRGLKFHEIS